LDKKFILKPKKPIELPLEAEVISPDLFSVMTIEEIESLPIYYGNRKTSIKKIFLTSGKPSDRLSLEGDLSMVVGIGSRMTRGEIIVKGNCGNFTGAGMKGGRILIEGNTADWLGSGMRGGLIEVRGSAGDFIGGAFPGEKFGMRGGTILVNKNSGKETGLRMLGGLITVKGRAGDFLGSGMKGGTIIVFSRMGQGPGFQMKGGTIIFLGEKKKYAPTLLPTFVYNCSFNPLIVRVLLKQLEKLGIKTDPRFLMGDYHRFINLLSRSGKGEILLFEPLKAQQTPKPVPPSKCTD
jgi:formylmethanofuran dehydrogenase subunit C